MPDPDEDLRALLGADPPASVTSLSPDARGELADILREAKQRQAQSMEDAFVATLKHVPFPVRGIVKKVLIG
jgi:hypothetical protein